MCSVIHHLLSHLCHSSTFVADHLYLGLCSGFLMTRFESITAMSKRSWEMPVILLFGCLEVRDVSVTRPEKAEGICWGCPAQVGNQTGWCPSVTFLAENLIIIYSCEKSLKFCESVNIFQVIDQSLAKLQRLYDSWVKCSVAMACASVGWQGEPAAACRWGWAENTDNYLPVSTE